MLSKQLAIDETENLPSAAHTRQKTYKSFLATAPADSAAMPERQPRVYSAVARGSREICKRKCEGYMAVGAGAALGPTFQE